jgi:hypothetical protein
MAKCEQCGRDVIDAPQAAPIKTHPKWVEEAGKVFQTVAEEEEWRAQQQAAQQPAQQPPATPNPPTKPPLPGLNPKT